MIPDPPLDPATVRRLVFRSLAQRPGRSLLLLLGYALGVGVTVALLAIGSALLVQAQDRELLGGGEVTVLPVGLDLETFRTGGVTSLYFTIEQAPFLYREVLAGPRFADRIEAAAPWIENQLVYVHAADTTIAVSADGQIPSLAAALGVVPEIRELEGLREVRGRVPEGVLVGAEGIWVDLPADRAWAEPSDSVRLASIDAFHLPGAAGRDSTWGEWHYFNVRGLEGDGWLYVTYLIGGEIPDGRWGGELFATLIRPGREARSFQLSFDPDYVEFHLDRPDLRLGDSYVTVDSDGVYEIRARIPGERPTSSSDTLTLALQIEPGVAYLPPLEVSPGGFPSGYTVPALAGSASGEVCVAGRCEALVETPAYHDHNWGVWRDVTWDWGQARLGLYAVLYGGVKGPEGEEGSRFLFLTDSMGFAGLFTIDALDYVWDEEWPDRFVVQASRGADSVSLAVTVSQARATPRTAGAAETAEAGEAAAVEGAEAVGRAAPDVFYQMEGPAELRGRVAGEELEAAGRGFFETWRRGSTQR
jgi:hypothetical protein